MNALSSLPPPSFSDLALRGGAPSVPSRASFETAGVEHGTLHVDAAAGARAIDDIERDFLAALCETRPA